ncbi:MAG: hypothetical protein J6F31_01660 [Oscillospiraceae bacterium]|nr:hypothetical protein [Oscillospiraceae bacterium]
MDTRSRMEDIFNKVLSGEMTAHSMYEALDELVNTAEEEDDLVCIAEECLIELDMSGNRKTSAKECAKMALEELSKL